MARPPDSPRLSRPGPRGRRKSRPYNGCVDGHTLEKLEFDAVRRLLAAQARTALGRGLAERIAPAPRAREAQHWLAQLRQLMDLMAARGMPPFAGVRDIRAMIRRSAPPSPLEPGDFGAIGETLTGLAALRRYFADLPESADRLRPLSERLGDFSEVADRIREVIDDAGAVRDDASDKLRKIRIDIARGTEEVRRVFDRLLRQPDVTRWLQYANATFHNDRMVLPLRAEQRGRVPGIIHRTSDSGQTLFVEPSAAVALNNALIELRQEESREISRLLWQLALAVHAQEREILRTLDAAAVIDLNVAKARLAAAFDMTLPAVQEGGPLRLTRARHPLLLAMRSDAGGLDAALQAVVPADIRLGDDFDLLVVTGPNTGGKTAALKTVGLLSLMALSGMPVPAASGATVPMMDDILIDVGDEQSLQQSLSTFSAHLARVQEVLSRATRDTLVLLDELGAGTDPDEGAALGHAVIEELLSRGCRTIVTTHLGALKAIAFQQPRAENAAVQFDVETLRPTYELRIGEPGESNAIKVARRLGLPDPILRRADELLAGQQRILSKAIEGTLEVRRRAEETRRAAEEAARRSDLQAEELRRQTAALEEESRRFARWMERVKSLRPGDRVRLTRFDREGTIVRVKLAHQQAVVSVGAMEYDVPFTEIDVGTV